jgi:hypothetical protein
MIIAGPCLYADFTDRERVLDTAKALKGTVDFFRCKLWGGGTTPEKYQAGFGNKGLADLDFIRMEMLPLL